MRLFLPSRKTSRKKMFAYEINLLSVARGNLKDWTEKYNETI